MYDGQVSASRSGASLLLWACTVVVLAAGFCLCAYSQTESGSISGIVTDTSGAVIAGTELLLVNIDRNTTVEARSDGFGFYRFEVVRPGRYRLEVRKQDFKVMNIMGLVVNTQDSLEENVHLERGSLIESATVVVETPKFAFRNGSVGSLVDNEFAINLPLNGRSLETLFTLIPGVTLVAGKDSTQGVAQLATNGQRNLSNVFSVDGVKSSPRVPPPAAGRAYGSPAGASPQINAIGGSPSIVSVDELEDLRVQTSTYSAQYGTSPGGQFMLTTRSGDDSFHGSAYLFFRHDVLEANDWFRNNYGLPLGTVRQWQPGGVFGGPLLIPRLYNGHARTFFFVSFEALSLVLQDNQSGTVPDFQLRTQLQSISPALSQVMDFSPLPNGPALQDRFGRRFDPWNRSNGSYSGAVRVDHTFSDALRAFVRYGDSSSVSINSGAPPMFANATSTMYASLTGGVTWNITPSLVSEARANHSSTYSSTKYGDLPGRGLLDFAPIHYDPSSYLVLFSIGNSSASEFLQQGATSTQQEQWQANDSLSWNHSAHSVKVGVDARWLNPMVNYFHDQASYYFFTGVSNQPDVLNVGNVATAEVGRSTRPQPFFRNYSLFADDVIRITRRLAVECGLRWEWSRLTSSASNLKGSSTPAYRHAYTDFAPRLGMAYFIANRPGWETVLRLGSGVFYDANDGPALSLLSDPPFSSRMIYNDAPFPLTASQLDLSPGSAPNRVDITYPTAFARGSALRSPVTYSWSLAIDQTFSNSTKLVTTYVGNGGRYLRGGGVVIPPPAPDSTSGIRYEVPSLSSRYEALQLQFQHRMSGRLQMFAAYTWAHALDNAPIYRGGPEPYVLSRGNSDADRRHVARAGVTYTLPPIALQWRIRGLLNGWGLALNIAAQSGDPFSVTNGSNLLVLPDGEQTPGLATIDPALTAWIRDPGVPGGWQLNPAVFKQTPVGVVGNSGRNTFRGFAIGQADIALTRECTLKEGLGVQVRADVFNVTNHPTFSNFSNTWGPHATVSNFGQAQGTFGRSIGDLNPLHQVGGPRNVQLAVRFTF